MKLYKKIFWIVLSIGAAVSIAFVTRIVNPAEKVNALWIVVAAACFYLITYRFYASFIAAKVLSLDERNVTPAIRLKDGVDYDPTDKWVLFGHHFAAIAGAGPLIGPMLAAQFGYLPGFLWILIGAALAGAVHDMVILAASVRRNGRSLAGSPKTKSGLSAGLPRQSPLFSSSSSRWRASGSRLSMRSAQPLGRLTISPTIPIALLMGVISSGSGRARSRRSASSAFRSWRWRCLPAISFRAPVSDIFSTSPRIS